MKLSAKDSTTLLDKISDPEWRYCNLYHIKRESDGKVIPFRPKPRQLEVFRDAQFNGISDQVILKARRYGFSTGIQIHDVDRILFNPGWQASLVDQTQGDASEKLRNVAKIAFQHLPDIIRDSFEITGSNDSYFAVKLRGKKSPSAIYAGKNARGGTNHSLHLSEWGVIQFEDSRRSEKILTGAIPSARGGFKTVETTWMGGKGGHVWDWIQPCIKNIPGNRRKLYFVPWHQDEDGWRDGDPNHMDAECITYLDELEMDLGITLTPGQRVYYFQEAWPQGHFRFREYPSTLEECFRSPIEGAIFQAEMDKQRIKGWIEDFEWDRSNPIHTFWDIGSPENTAIWYVQFVGPEIWCVQCDFGIFETTVDRVARMKNLGLPLGNHYLPHDAGATLKNGLTYKDELEAAGLNNIKVIPQTRDVWVGIMHLSSLMSRMRFHDTNCALGIEALENYHTKVEEVTGHREEKIVHDWSSHPSDALRYLAESHLQGMIEGRSGTAKSGKNKRLIKKKSKIPVPTLRRISR